jgi:hypothetical protein
MTEPSAVDTSAESTRYRETFNRLKDEFRAIPADQLLTLNVAPLIAVKTLLTSLPAIKAMRSRLIAEFARTPTARPSWRGRAVFSATQPLRGDVPQLPGQLIDQRLCSRPRR